MWKSEEDKLKRSGRKWQPSPDYMPYRCAELFCEECGASLGVHDIVCTNLESAMYCSNCVQKYVKDTPIILCSQSDKPASRAVNFFLLALQAMLASVGLANNVDAYRFGTLEKRPIRKAV